MGSVRSQLLDEGAQRAGADVLALNGNGDLGDPGPQVAVLLDESAGISRLAAEESGDDDVVFFLHMAPEPLAELSPEGRHPLKVASFDGFERRGERRFEPPMAGDEAVS